LTRYLALIARNDVAFRAPATGDFLAMNGIRRKGQIRAVDQPKERNSYELTHFDPPGPKGRWID